jgi:predicted NUDIX family NTP pyrophosphohydrolase
VVSAGILLYRRRAHVVEVLLAHPGGPFWVNRDDGAWSVPKGEADDDEDHLEVARREFNEELGIALRCDEPQSLGAVTQKSGKVVFGWACEGDLDPADQHSNTFTAEWPPRSGRTREFPEVDRVDWFGPEVARRKLNPAQAVFVDRLLELLNESPTTPGCGTIR